MSTEIDVYNLALAHVGSAFVTAPSESPVCQTMYPWTRDTLLSWAPWTFATTRAALARLAVAPAADFLYQYALPAHPYPLRLLDIDTRHRRYRREVYFDAEDPDTQQNVILTDADTVVLKYIARTSEAVWPPMFINVLGLWLGLAITQHTSGKATMRQQIFRELQTQLDRLIDVDGHQDSPPLATLNEAYIAARGGTDDWWAPFQDIEEAL